ncbi:facilitated trehalose transporter Tret1-like [Maniola jurtina]|uniref:facilitated trehalose transporter Tret1-like n=1 Tax=Maniola jurtina TaxID=191418 RepID=UPI001E688CC8|nr:facilitated trehalose transporter Tret1-like [Maniola jurtina]
MVKMKSVFEFQQFQDVQYVLKQVLATLVTGWFTVIAGFAFGFSAVLLPELQKDEDFDYDADMASWIASITPLSMVFGCVSSGYLIDYLGRKPGHMVLAVTSLISWLIIAFAANNVHMLIGRFIAGLSVGASRPVSLVYIGEITDPKYRSLTLVAPSISMGVGIITSHILGGYVSWRHCCYIYGALNASCVILFLFLKESPLWLISKGKIDEGTQAFKWFRGQDIDSEKELQLVLLRQNEKSNQYFYKDVMSLSFIKPLLIILLLSFVQFNGANVFSFYAQEMIETSFKGSIDPFAFMIGIDVVRFVIIILIFAFNKFIPRKIFFLTANFCCGISLFILVVYLLNLERFGSIGLSITITVLFISFGGSVVTLGWSFVPELFSANLRGLGSGIAAAMSYLVLFVCVKISPGVAATYGDAAMYAFYGVVTVINNLILCFVLPETSGRSLQEIEDSYKKSGTTVSSL